MKGIGLTRFHPSGDHLLALTGGHPHDSAVLLVCNLAQAGRQTVDVTDIELALRQVLTTDIARYSELWESLTPNQRRVLAAVARSGGQEDIRSPRFRDAHGLQSYRSVDYASTRWSNAA